MLVSTCSNFIRKNTMAAKKCSPLFVRHAWRLSGNVVNAVYTSGEILPARNLKILNFPKSYSTMTKRKRCDGKNESRNVKRFNGTFSASGINNDRSSTLKQEYGEETNGTEPYRLFKLALEQAFGEGSNNVSRMAVINRILALEQAFVNETNGTSARLASDRLFKLALTEISRQVTEGKCRTDGMGSKRRLFTLEDHFGASLSRMDRLVVPAEFFGQASANDRLFKHALVEIFKQKTARERKAEATYRLFKHALTEICDQSTLTTPRSNENSPSLLRTKPRNVNHTQVRNLTNTGRRYRATKTSVEASDVKLQPAKNDAQFLVESPGTQEVLTQAEYESFLAMFPGPKNVLHNVFCIVARELKCESYNLKPVYTMRISKGVTSWDCTYHLKWPEDLKFTQSACTKQDASTRAALAALIHLKLNNKLTKDKHPILSQDISEVNSCTSGKIPSKPPADIVTKDLLPHETVIDTSVIKPEEGDIQVITKDLAKLNIIQDPLSPAVVKDLLASFPQPKNALHGIFNTVAQELKNNNYNLTPMYTLRTKSRGATYWDCMYHLKWPEDVKFSQSARTKQEASIKASLVVLNYLKVNDKLEKDKNGFFFKQISEINVKKYKELALKPAAVRGMTDIINCYEKDFLPHLTVVEDDGEVMSDCKALEESWPKKRTTRSVNNRLNYESKELVPLPISKFKEDVIKAIQTNRIVVIKGEPGCGKSTRVPQYVLEGWAKESSATDDDCRIIVTQPRRIAAISLAERVSNEREEQVGTTIGYQVRFKSNFNHSMGRVLYCTTGILLRRLQTDPKLSDCTHVILDEAHERDVNTDLLMNLLKQALDLNPALKLVVMSATIDAEVFQRYFDDAALVHIPGFTYPIKVNFLSETRNLEKTLAMCNGKIPAVVHEDVAKLITYIHKTRKEGAILCFLPGWDDIIKVKKLLPLNSNDQCVLSLHSRIPDSEQRMIFSRQPPGVRKIILATNIAETSVTIDDVVYVVDTGLQKETRFDVEKGIVCIDNCWISKASMAQRKGRAGRVQSGESFHLYPQSKYNEFIDYSVPEILRTSLTKIVLDSKVFSNNMIASEFLGKLLSPPDSAAVSRAVDELKDLELLDSNENLTPLGRVLSDFQLEPKLGKAMVNSVVFKCVTPVVDVVTLFAAETEIFRGSLTDKESVNKAKRDFSRSSDHLSLMRVLEKWLEFVEHSDYGMAERFCENNNLVNYKLRTIQQLREIHFGYLHKGLTDILPISDNYSDSDELVKAILLSGVGQVLQHRDYDFVKGRLKKCNVLMTRNNHRATITAESVNYKRRSYPSDFLLYINETRSNIRRITVVRETSLIPPLTVLLFKNNRLLIEEVPKNRESSGLKSDDQVLLKLEGTKIEFVCDKRDAELVKKCKESINSGLQYYIFQLTKGKQYNQKLNKSWDDIISSLSKVLEGYSV